MDNSDATKFLLITCGLGTILIVFIILRVLFYSCEFLYGCYGGSNRDLVPTINAPDINSNSERCDSNILSLRGTPNISPRHQSYLFIGDKTDMQRYATTSSLSAPDEEIPPRYSV